jgi:hypothetical protein
LSNILCKVTFWDGLLGRILLTISVFYQFIFDLGGNAVMAEWVNGPMILMRELLNDLMVGWFYSR